MGTQLISAQQQALREILTGTEIRKVMEARGLVEPTDTLYVVDSSTRAYEKIEPDKTYNLQGKQVEVLPLTESGS